MVEYDEKYRLGPSNSVEAIQLPDGSIYPDMALEKDFNSNRRETILRFYTRKLMGPDAAITFMDLGCNEGVTCLNLGRDGDRVIGLEGRDHSARRGRFLAEILGMDRVSIQTANILDFSAIPKADGAFAAGILYHLTDPIGFLDALGRNTSTAIYIDSHFAPDTEDELASSNFASVVVPRQDVTFNGHNLKTFWYREPAKIEEIDDNKKYRHPRSGMGADHSIWLQLDGWREIMAYHGFIHAHSINVNKQTLRAKFLFTREEIGGFAPEYKEACEADRKQILANLEVDRKNQIEKAVENDLNFLRNGKTEKDRALVISSPEWAHPIMRLLKRNDVSVEGMAIIRERGSDGGFSRSEIDRCLRERKPNFVILADDIFEPVYRHLMLDAQLDYVFTSFASHILQTEEEKTSLQPA